MAEAKPVPATWKTGAEIGSSLNPAIALNKTAGSPSEFGVQPMDSHKKPDMAVGFGRNPWDLPKPGDAGQDGALPEITVSGSPTERNGSGGPDLLAQNNQRLDALTPGQFEQVRQQAVAAGREQGQQTQEDLARVINRVTGSTPRPEGNQRSPSYSTTPSEGSRARPENGVGDLPPGPKTGAVEAPIALGRSADLSGSRPRPYPVDQIRAEGSYDASGAFNQLDRLKAAKAEEVGGPEQVAQVERAGRLANLQFVKGWMQRVGNFAGGLSEAALANIPRRLDVKGVGVDTRLGVGLVALGLIAAALLSSEGGGQSAQSSGPAQMGSSPKVESSYRPPAEEIADSLAPREAAAAPAVDTDPIKFPENVTNRTMDGLIRAKIVALDPDFQANIAERGIRPEDVSDQDPAFQKALFKATQEAGGGDNFNKVVGELDKSVRGRIEQMNRYFRVFDSNDPNRIVVKEFNMPKIDLTQYQSAVTAVRDQQALKVGAR